MDREGSINLLAAILADLPQLSIYLRATTNRPSWAVANAAAPLTRSSWSAYGPTSTLTVGHKHDPGKYGGRVLPPDEPSARKIVEVAALPMSTVWIHSGGGLYGWWLLYVPFTVTGDSRGCGWAVETLAGRLGRWRGVAGLLLRHGCVRSGPSAAAARNGQPQGPRGPATVPHSVQWRAASCIG